MISRKNTIKIDLSSTQNKVYGAKTKVVCLQAEITEKKVTTSEKNCPEFDSR
jgi:hypothetical protein